MQTERRYKKTSLYNLPGLRERKAIIIGGTGALGSAAAIGLAAQGCSVAIIYKSNDRVAKKVKAEASTYGVVVDSVRCDCRSFAHTLAAFDALRPEFRKINFLINASGTHRRQLIELSDMSDQVFRAITDVNLGSVLWACRASLSRMEDHGRIINFSTIIASRGYIKGALLHGSTKASIEALTRLLAVELAPRKICVNTIAPGYVYGGDHEPGDKKLLENLKNQIPFGDPTTPESISGVVNFLCSSLSEYITGQVIAVSGGLFL